VSSDAAVAAPLLERGLALERLRTALASAEHGEGRLAFVSGEAGVGKTTLVHRFCEGQLESTRVLVGTCDALFTPRPLGPFLDVAESVGGRLRDVVDGSARPHDVSVALLEELLGRPTILVVEDVHRADDATLDVLGLLGRRIQRSSAVVIATYRDDELAATHPLRIVLGELATQDTIVRVRVEPLSLDAIADLAAPYDLDPAELYRTTGGNPFFATEILAAVGPGIPQTVRDAVLARTARLSPAATNVLEAVVVVPHEVELWLLARLTEGASDALEECLASGILTEAPGGVRFRHELARATIEESLSPARRAHMHRRVLEALMAPPTGERDLARIAHHAERADDERAVLEFAPAAGTRAAVLGAHREAAAQFARALRFADNEPIGTQVELLNGHSVQCYLTAQEDDALASADRAIECYRLLGDPTRHGAALRWRAMVQLNRGFALDATQTAHSAVALLEDLPPGPELALTYAALASLGLLAEDGEEVALWGARSIELAKELGHAEAYVSALGSLGAVEALRGSNAGRAQLERSLELATEAGLENQVGRAYVFLGMAGSRERSLDAMTEYVRLGLAFSSERDLVGWTRFFLAMRGWIELERGDWDAAGTTAAVVLRSNCTLSSLQANIVLGLLRARRGDPDPWTPLDAASEVAERTGQLWWLSQVAAARAEAAWLEGKPQVVALVTDAPFTLALERRSPWPVAELAYWRRRAGIEQDVPVDAGGPFAFQLRGEWAQAAELWRASGSPYEEALALSEADDEGALRRALDEAHRLGAQPLARVVSRRLRELGVRDLPRGPRRSTLANPAGLTSRESEILHLLSDGLRNAEIAERLVVSPRTVDHHVSAILRKLGVRSRAQAIAAARDRLLLQDR
jgi:DNA-binding CsgD family transcriptional regulator